jgi:hypothetical protein
MRTSGGLSLILTHLWRSVLGTDLRTSGGLALILTHLWRSVSNVDVYYPYRSITQGTRRKIGDLIILQKNKKKTKKSSSFSNTVVYYPYRSIPQKKELGGKKSGGGFTGNKAVATLQPLASPPTAAPTHCSSGVNICTFVPISKYFCTSNASARLINNRKPIHAHTPEKPVA